jgi:hypothetical protein
MSSAWGSELQVEFSWVNSEGNDNDKWRIYYDIFGGNVLLDEKVDSVKCWTFLLAVLKAWTPVSAESAMDQCRTFQNFDSHFEAN